MKLSIVTTMYKSLPYLETFIRQMTEVVEQMSIIDYEMIFVNDGSPDSSLQYMLSQQHKNAHIRIVDLSRNFGHHYALQAGIDCSCGDLVYLVDNDLETPAAFLEQCYKEIDKDASLDLVYGVQETRKGHFVEKIGGKLFWKIFNAISDSKVPENILTECLMTRKFVNELSRLKDANLFLAGMIHWVGLNKKELICKKGQRKGKSTYSFSKRLALMIQAITTFSGKPLEWLFYFGLSITGISAFFLLYLLIKKLILGDLISIGWTSTIGVSLLSLGLISMFLGLIGLYVYRIYRQVQGRPNYIIKKIY